MTNSAQCGESWPESARSRPLVTWPRLLDNHALISYDGCPGNSALRLDGFALLCYYEMFDFLDVMSGYVDQYGMTQLMMIDDELSICIAHIKQKRLVLLG